MKKIYIRVDGGSSIGIGHVVRMLVLGAKLKKFYKIIFLCLKSNFKNQFGIGIKLIKRAKFKVITLKNNNSIYKMNKRDDCLITALPYLQKQYFYLTSKNFKKTIIFDNTNNSKIYYGDLLINPEIYAKKLKYNLEKNIKKKRKNKILITFGGSDPKNFTKKILKKINKMKNLKFRVVIGPGFKTDFSQFKKKHNNFNFIKNADMGKEIEKADLVLSACGTTVYESMYLKSNIIGFKIAHDQRDAYNYLGTKKFIVPSNPKKIKQDITKSMLLIKRNKKINHISNFPDSFGSERILEEIKKIH